MGRAIGRWLSAGVVEAARDAGALGGRTGWGENKGMELRTREKGLGRAAGCVEEIGGWREEQKTAGRGEGGWVGRLRTNVGCLIHRSGSTSGRGSSGGVAGDGAEREFNSKIGESDGNASAGKQTTSAAS